MNAVPWLIWLLPLTASPFVIGVSLISERASKWFAVFVSGFSAVIGIYQAFTFSNPYSETLANWILNPYTSVSLQVQVDGLSVLLSAFISFLSFVIVLYAVENMRLEKGQPRFYFLVLLFIGAMLGLVMAGNLIQLYFMWEIVGICSALLIAFWTEKESARKAGFKAFVVTRFGDIALLIAVILVLITLGTTNLNSISDSIDAQGFNSTWLLVGILVFIGAMGKSAQVPLHVWLPDAMEGPTPVSALIHAATMVNAGVYIVVRLSSIYSVSAILSAIVLVIGLLTMLVGAASACAEQDLKRILAYSTISQLGLMFAAVGLGNFSGAIYQLISQGIFKALAFMAAGSVIEAIGTRNIENMGGLRKVMKYTHIGFLFSMLSMVGLPPLMGFWTKDSILSGALLINRYAFVLIAIASVLTSLYGFRALIKVFYGSRITEARESPMLMIGPMLALVISVVMGWLVLDYQSIFLPTLGRSLDIITLATTIVVLLAGLAVAYYAFLLKISPTQRLIQGNELLRRGIVFISEGFGFDRAYCVLQRIIVTPLVRGAKAIQTGTLGNNIVLMLITLLLLVLLITMGVL